MQWHRAWDACGFYAEDDSAAKVPKVKPSYTPRHCVTFHKFKVKYAIYFLTLPIHQIYLSAVGSATCRIAAQSKQESCMMAETDSLQGQDATSPKVSFCLIT